MVRSTSSCLKIIACGVESVDKDDFAPTESKGSTDKRRWSFGKISSRHRVLSNTIISETPSTANKESPESTIFDFHPQNNPIVPAKISVPQWTDETPELMTAENLREPDSPIAMENASKIDPNLEESVAIVIQAAVRRYLAQRTLLELKNVVKLQAAVRGHLVRRQAVGTLRCVQAIIKMQALVRARRARLLVEGSVNEEKLDGKHQRKYHILKPLGKENSGTKANKSYSSNEMLLSNGFARQLLESTPKTKPIHVKCDPLRPNSAWKWLERWMSVSSVDFAQAHKPECPVNREQGDNTEVTASEVGPEIPAEDAYVSADLKSSTRETVAALDSEESLITHDADNFDFQACHPNYLSRRDDLDQPQVEGVDLGQAREASSMIDFLPNQTEIQSGAILQTVLDSAAEESEIAEKPEIDTEQSERATKRVASEQLETEGKMFVLGSRKGCNPAFVAAQAKFEELSSTATSGRSISCTYQEVRVESKLDNLPSPADSVPKAKEFCLKENWISHDPKVQVGGSVCAMELSITSTLNSPDRSEVGGGEIKHEAEIAKRGTPDLDSTADKVSDLETLDLEAKNVSSMSLPNLSCPDPNKRESIDPVVSVDSSWVGQQPERSVSDVQIQLDTVIDQQKSSPEGSPRSHITAPESNGTPSSQISIKAKRNKPDRNGRPQNRRSQASGTRSPSNEIHDSGARSSTEQLPKDPKNGKRRNSFGSAIPDPIDQEQRDSSCSSNSIPNYMQATESARAKAHTHNSPRLSPDVHDKDFHIKKRHSLPSANGKQGSSRLQQSISQVQQGAKGNGTHSPHERKWQR